MCPGPAKVAAPTKAGGQPRRKCILDIRSKELDSFLREAEVTQELKQILLPRFERACELNDAGLPVLSYRGFVKLVRRSKACKTEDEENFFRTMCRDGSLLSFDDLVLGCAAAGPSTLHSVNSYTGRIRARYIFDFYDRSGSGTWDFEELSRMLFDSSKTSKDPEEHLKGLLHWAQELGEVDVLTLRIHGSSGPLCEFRASRKWCGSRIMREISLHLKVPQTGLKLQIEGHRFRENDILESLVPRGDAVRIDVISIDWDSYPAHVESIFADRVPGLERLVHVHFNRFLKVVESLELSGTSRLFRFDRDLLRNRSGVASRGSSTTTTPTGGAACALKSAFTDRLKITEMAAYGGA